MCHMKYNGQGYRFCKKNLLILVHVKALEAVEAGQKIAIFQIQVKNFFVWQNLIF